MNTAAFSLLWPQGYDAPTGQPDSFVATDLNLTRLIWSLSFTPHFEGFVRGILLSLSTDVDTIRYRQSVLADLLHNPDLVQDLEILLEQIATVEGYLQSPQWKENVLRQVAWRLSELEHYIDTVNSLDALLARAGDNIKSDGLRRLRETVQTIIATETFQSLQAELPDLLPRIRDIRSITVVINLDGEMRPLSAALMEARTERMEGESMMARLFGMLSQSANANKETIGRLHDARHIKGVSAEEVELRNRNSPFMPQLFKDLSELLDETSQPIVKALQKYTQVNSQVLVGLKLDLAFYIGAVKLIRRLQKAGVPMSQPEPLPVNKREIQYEGLYNINLALQHLSNSSDVSDIVGNDVHFGNDGRIFILTGPNQGGKTTYTQAIGLAQMMFQAGLYVPAKSARLSPVDAIYTHFSTEERPNLEAGRLGEEARRLNDIFLQATPHSLILLNESLASTAANESLFLAQDVVKAMRLLGVRAVFATHLLELAAQADVLNAETAGDSKIISVVSQVRIEHENNGQQVKRTYVIQPGPPMQKSYAIELAARYGISFEQISAMLKNRNVL